MILYTSGNYTISIMHQSVCVLGEGWEEGDQKISGRANMVLPISIVSLSEAPTNTVKAHSEIHISTILI